MNLRDLIESEEITQKKKLSEIMKNFKSIIERYEINGEVHKDDQSKMETLKDMISHMIKQEDKRNED